MLLRNKQTGVVYEVIGSVNKLVACLSFVDENNQTVTTDIVDPSFSNDEYEIVEE